MQSVGRKKLKVSAVYSSSADVVLYHGDCIELLKDIPDGSMQLIVTSPPYNIGKAYERRMHMDTYLAQQGRVIDECVRVLSPTGSICWQVGNYVNKSEIVPLDMVLYPIFCSHGLHLRNRIVWHFEHGLHCKKRLSGRYETILWFTKTNEYTFDLDPIRVPQKYPQKKYFKGPKAGMLSCNPAGKNPGDVWVIPNVKSNHVEKTSHPCQFPVELVERLVLSLTEKGDWVLDPFIGAGSTAAAAVLRGRKCAGAETVQEYIEIARERVEKAAAGTLLTRPMDRPVYDPKNPPRKKKRDTAKIKEAPCPK